MRLIDADFVKLRMRQTMDYQDLYLPVHFEMLLNEAIEWSAKCRNCKHWKQDAEYDYVGKCYAWADLVIESDWVCADWEEQTDGTTERE